MLKAVGTAAVATQFPAGCTRSPIARPNVILIVADDASAKEFGCYGSAEHATPFIDHLADTGVKFETCWATPMCSPSRAEIMTGRYGFRTGWYHNYLKPGPKEPGGNLGKSNIILAEALRSAGYRTGICGKWQLQGTEDAHGFDEFCLWRYHKRFNGPVETKEEGLSSGRASRYWHPAIVQNGQPVPTTVDDYGPDIFTDFAVDFAARYKHDPFFIHYAMCLPHVAWDFGARREGYLPVPEVDDSGTPTGRSVSGSLKSNIEYIDTLIGRIVSALERLELRSRTVVLFTADNGTLGNGKNSTFMEHGPRVPMIVNCPGLIKAAGAVPTLIDFSDVWPTVLQLAKSARPDGYVVDGRSFLPTLLGQETEGQREWIFSFLFDRRFLRDQRWLLDGDGNLFDCHGRRDETGYTNVTRSDTAEVRVAREWCREVLADLPPPPADLVAAAREEYRDNRFLPPPLDNPHTWLKPGP